MFAALIRPTNLSWCLIEKLGMPIAKNKLFSMQLTQLVHLDDL